MSRNFFENYRAGRNYSVVSYQACRVPSCFLRYWQLDDALFWPPAPVRTAMDDLNNFCCQNPDCPDYGRRDLGNLRVCFRNGPNKQRRVLACRTCQQRFSERKGTPLYRAKLPEDKASRLPAVSVSYRAARKYAASVGGLLSTEAQWEYAAKSRQDGSLITRSGADLEHVVPLADFEFLGHQRHHVGLTDALPLADRQGHVLISSIFERSRHELLARCLLDRPENSRIADTGTAQRHQQSQLFLDQRPCVRARFTPGCSKPFVRHPAR